MSNKSEISVEMKITKKNPLLIDQLRFVLIVHAV